MPALQAGPQQLPDPRPDSVLALDGPGGPRPRANAAHGRGERDHEARSVAQDLRSTPTGGERHEGPRPRANAAHGRGEREHEARSVARELQSTPTGGERHEGPRPRANAAHGRGGQDNNAPPIEYDVCPIAWSVAPLEAAR
jgi:hypothetical protein